MFLSGTRFARVPLRKFLFVRYPPASCRTVLSIGPSVRIFRRLDRYFGRRVQILDELTLIGSFGNV